MQPFTKKLAWLCAVTGSAMMLPATAWAAGSAGTNAQVSFGMESAVDTRLLEQMRGGFSVDTGVKVSFGIERTVSINGDVVSNTRLNLQNPEQLANAQVDTQALQGGAVELIQNGLGNNFQLGKLSEAAAATFIQNSLNDQTIQSTTIINATSNSLEHLKNLNTQSALNDALANSVSLR
jgi:hypothetical protein